MDPNAGGAITFEIDGNSYVTTLIPAEHGIGILARLVSIVGEPIAALAETVLRDPAKLARVLAAARNSGDKTRVEELIEGVSLGGLGRDLRTGLASVPAAPLLRDLTRTTHRNGKPLRDDREFDAAFRGNYGELFRLAWELIKVNRLFPLPATSANDAR